jgi:hypothetical protein
VRLTAYERRVARCMAGAIFPKTAPALPGGEEVATDAFLEEWLARAPARMRLGARVALWAFALAPLLLIGRLALGTSLDGEVRDRYAAAWMSHRLYLVRSLGLFLKAMASFAYFRDPRVQAALSLPGA